MSKRYDPEPQSAEPLLLIMFLVTIAMIVWRWVTG